MKNPLFIKTYRDLFLDLSGIHTSKTYGSSLEFKELREYISGDDIRYINWKVTARANKPIINQFYDNKRLNIVTILLSSGSLYFGSIKQKIKTAIKTLLLLNYSAIYNNDMLLSAIFNTSLEKEYTQINQNTQKLLEQYLLNIDILKKDINYESLINYLLSIKQKSIIFLIGDFFEEVDFKLVSKKHELNLIIIRDKFEEDLNLYGEFNLVDTNNLQETEIFLEKEVINYYKKTLKNIENRFFNHLHRNKIKYTKIYTHQDELIKLKEFL